MKVALAVNRVLPDIDVNLATIIRMASEAASRSANLILFPEAALTGLINNDDPAHDLPLGQPIPGPVTATLARLSHALHLYLAIGLLERDGNNLYDSALLFDRRGAIAHNYRRIDRGWHGRAADPAIYRSGQQLSKVETELGSLAFLLCGDLFDDDLIRHMHALCPDWLLFPFARSFDDGSCNQARWDQEEKPAYLDRMRLFAATTFMTNYLADESLAGDYSFGGAMVVRGDGNVIASLPLGREGMLLVDA